MKRQWSSVNRAVTHPRVKRRSPWQVLLLALATITLAASSWGQTRVDLRTQGKSVDFSTATSTKPMRTGTTLPVTCSPGETFFKTNAAAGQNVYGCTSQDVWTVQSSTNSLPPTNGNADKVLTNDGTVTEWRPMGGDISGPPESVLVTRIQGRRISTTAPGHGNSLVWNATANHWEPAAGGGGPADPSAVTSPDVWMQGSRLVRTDSPGFRAVRETALETNGIDLTVPGNLIVGKAQTSGLVWTLGNASDTGASGLTIRGGDGAGNSEPGYYSAFSSSPSNPFQSYLFPCGSAGKWCTSAGIPGADSTDHLLTVANTSTLQNKAIDSTNSLTGFLDIASITPPENPIGTNLRLFADSLTGKLTCRTSSGMDCMPDGVGGTGGYTTVQEEGTSLPQRSAMSFQGAGITATDDAPNFRTNVTLAPNLNAFATKSAPAGLVVGTTDTQTLSAKTLDNTNRFTSSFLVTKSAAPANPMGSDVRVWVDSNSGKLACKDSSGADCMPAPGSSSTHTLLGSAHSDTNTGAVARGSLITGQGLSPAWGTLALGPAGSYLRSNGTDLLYSAISAGDLPVSAVKSNQANTYTSGAKQTFAANFATAGANVACSQLPASPAAGDIACDSNDGNKLKQHNGNSWLDLSAVSSGAPPAGAVQFILDGSGSAITPGAKGWIKIPYAGTITGWELTADQAGSIVIDLWKDSFANFPPTVDDTIFDTKPTLPASQTNSATGLSIPVSAGDYIRLRVNSANTVQYVVLALTINRS